ncbi:unnamed protein product [Hymenolepis diminuta]|uniref:Transmembrane protein n=1 Tax=Hymenolepis diminuta TaxID=6216 RepID=A0A0R3SWX8_HYMDI|nr:unnamed protein product [Hymenolepis diminuta]VUZ57318.1 unnamed protein product [Hymenolepis diminuta]
MTTYHQEVKSFNEFFTVSDAVRRSIRVEAEGVEKRVTVGGTFCLSGGVYWRDYCLFGLLLLLISITTGDEDFPSRLG